MDGAALMRYTLDIMGGILALNQISFQEALFVQHVSKGTIKLLSLACDGAGRHATGWIKSALTAFDSIRSSEFYHFI